MISRILFLPFVLTGFAALPARAAFIIDDFDDPAQGNLPETENELVLTSGVGILNAERGIGASSSQTDPIGLVDVNVTRPSHFTARIDGQFLNHPENTPLLAVGASYNFAAPTDLTEGGINNAILIDVSIFQGSGLPGSLSLGGLAGSGSFQAIVSRSSLLSDSPYTIVLPFSSFGPRGGGIGAVDFSTIELLGVTIRLLQGSRNPDTNWLVQVDRIRVDRVVPEPNTIALITVTALLAHLMWNRSLTASRF